MGLFMDSSSPKDVNTETAITRAILLNLLNNNNNLNTQSGFWSDILYVINWTQTNKQIVGGTTFIPKSALKGNKLTLYLKYAFLVNFSI